MRIVFESPCKAELWGPIKAVTAEQMRALDQRASDQYGIPSLLLMENAGRAVARTAMEMLGGNVQRKRILIVAGQGNNGGDGFVAARHLHNAGAQVVIAYAGERDRAKGDVLVNIEIAERMGLSIAHCPFVPGFWRGHEQETHLVIDALLGTGAKGALRAPYDSIIERMWDVHSKALLLAVDIPSGLDADTGQWPGPYAPPVADVTVTFALPKIGLLTYPGAEFVGELRVADIGIPRAALGENDAQTYVLDASGLSGEFHTAVTRRPDSHKGTFGHCAIVAGSVGMTGAATLAAEGALRIGTGLVTLLVPESLNDIMEVKVTEAMTIPVPQGRARAFGMASLRSVQDYVQKWDSAIIGPGFGRDEDTVEFTLELLRGISKPAIVDADALFAVSTDVGVLRQCKAPLVITPHPGEMAALTGTTAAQVQSNRLEAARSFAAEHGVTVVLKGAGTVVAQPDGTAWINTTGTPGMATGGTGDVLSGMIGGLLAQRLSPSQAACAAVYLHGRAGELAAGKLGEAAMIAGDVAGCIGSAILEVAGE